MTIQTKATEQYFPVVLFILLYKVVLTFESVDEILQSDNSSERSPKYFPKSTRLTLQIRTGKMKFRILSIEFILFLHGPFWDHNTFNFLLTHHISENFTPGRKGDRNADRSGIMQKWTPRNQG